MSSKKQLLDPLGTICKLIALNFCEVQTKISIHEHILTLQSPNKYQFAVRFYNGDARENISELFYVMVRIIRWYFMPIEDNDSPGTYDIDNINWISIRDSPEIRKITTYLCCGLRRLQETYEFGNVVLAIQYYINILENALDGKFTNNSLPKYIIDKEKEYKNLINYDKLKNFWDINKLKRVCDLYDQCFYVSGDKNHNGDMNALIDSYLQSVYSLLELSDKDFQILIQNSNKG